MSTCAVIGLSIAVLIGCIAGVVAINRAVAREMGESDYEPY